MSSQSAIRNPQSAILIGGTIAIDHVKTPNDEATNLLGGSASYAAIAASYFTSPVHLVGIIGKDFPEEHIELFNRKNITLEGVERSSGDSFSWSGEYHENMNDRTTHQVDINVLENWSVKIPPALTATPIVVLANMSPDNQLQMLEQLEEVASGECGMRNDSLDSSTPHSALATPHFIVADTMDLWISIANERLHEVLKRIDLLVINEGEAREFAGTSNLVVAGQRLLAKGPKHVVIKLGEFGAILFSANAENECEVRNAECETKESLPTSSSFPTPHSALPTSHFSLFRCAAFPLAEVADPTGAGDSFLGALAGYLAATGKKEFSFEDIRQAVVQGSVVASFTCEAFSTRRLQELTPEKISERYEFLKSITHW